MDSRWANEHLQVIRTLMERATVYRRALAPMMLASGCLGLAGAAVGILGDVERPRSFAALWIAIGLLAAGVAAWLVRRQALKEHEPVWSPPARRVAMAVLPAFSAGAVLGLVGGFAPAFREASAVAVWLPVAWLVLYGCAAHAAGFFMPRGIKVLGWIFVAGGCGFAAFHDPGLPMWRLGHLAMGAFFGALHLAYGGYLLCTERKDDPV